MIFKFRMNQGFIRTQIRVLFRIMAVCFLDTPLSRAGANDILLAVGKGILQLCQGICQDGYHSLRKTKIDQWVTQPQVKQFSLPQGDFSFRCSGRVQLHLYGIIHLLGGIGDLRFLPKGSFNVPAIFLLNPLW